MTASRDDIANVLAHAELTDELTGCGMEAALKSVLALMRGALEPTPEPAPAPEPAKPTLRPYNEDRFVAFLERSMVGADWTAPGICEKLGMAFPPYAKHPAQVMMRHGWVAIGILNGCRLYRKAAPVAEAAQ